MFKKLLFSLAFVSFANAGFSQFVVEKALPEAPISTTATNFMKCRINSLVSNPVAPCDIVINISEVSATSYPTCGAILRWKNDQKNLINPDNLIDLRNGGSYQFNTDGLKIVYDKDYFVFFKYDLTVNPKTYTVYARTEDMTEMYILGENLQFRTVPATALNLYSVLYVADTAVAPVPTLKIKEFKTSLPLTYASSIAIGTSSVALNQPTQLTATTVPETANAGVVWKIKTGAEAATITNDGIITITQNVPVVVVVEAYAVNLFGGFETKATKTITTTTGLNDVQSSPSIKLNPTVSKTGIYTLQMSENFVANNTFKVYDICGQIIHTGVVEGSNVNIGTTKPGMYFVNFSYLTGNKTAQVLVQ